MKYYFIWGIDFDKDTVQIVTFTHTQEGAEEYLREYDGPLSLFWEKKELNYV